MNLELEGLRALSSINEINFSDLLIEPMRIFLIIIVPMAIVTMVMATFYSLNLNLNLNLGLALKSTFYL